MGCMGMACSLTGLRRIVGAARAAQAIEPQGSRATGVDPAATRALAFAGSALRRPVGGTRRCSKTGGDPA